MKPKAIKTYYGYHVMNFKPRSKDINKTQLQLLKERKDFRQALAVVIIGFVALTAFAIWASHNVGNVY